MSLGLAVPLFNEGPLVDEVVDAYVGALAACDRAWRLVLVNNGSEDDTGRQLDAHAQRPGVEVVHLVDNAGYGGGILAGLNRLRAEDGSDMELVGWGWGDGQVDPTVLPSLVAACEHGADLAKVRRVSRHDGWRRRLVTRSYARINHVLGARSADVNGCPKLMWRRRFDELALCSTDWFLDPELIWQAEARGWVVTEVPAAMRQRRAGRSKVRWTTVVGFSARLAAWHLGARR
jgi:glycosyltransferase involved in cell wall biosynthesis